MSYALHSLAMAFGFLGLVFLLILLHGVLHADKQALIAFDQWLAVCFLNDAYADETISAWAHRKHGTLHQLDMQRPEPLRTSLHQ